MQTVDAEHHLKENAPFLLTFFPPHLTANFPDQLPACFFFKDVASKMHKMSCACTFPTAQ